MLTKTTLVALLLCALVRDAASVQTPQAPQVRCEGDLRGDQKCNHDSTHRVCAKIGDPGTSFWAHTGQSSWCNKDTYGDGRIGCPYPEKPTWCICKWATAGWIKGETCNERIEIDCDATDICATEVGLFFSYDDFNVDLKPARDCVKVKCADIWQRCEEANNPEPADPCADVACAAVVCEDGTAPPVPAGACCGDLSLCPPAPEPAAVLSGETTATGIAYDDLTEPIKAVVCDGIEASLAGTPTVTCSFSSSEDRRRRRRLESALSVVVQYDAQYADEAAAESALADFDAASFSESLTAALQESEELAPFDIASVVATPPVVGGTTDGEPAEAKEPSYSDNIVNDGYDVRHTASAASAAESPRSSRTQLLLAVLTLALSVSAGLAGSM